MERRTGLKAGRFDPVAGGVGARIPDAGFEHAGQAGDAQAADLQAGKWYFNIHTAANKGGEIRGQVMKGM